MLRKTILAALIALPTLLFAVEPVDINTADAVTIANTIKGIGQVKAEAIVAHRKKYGNFSSVDDLVLVKGIGEKTVDANRDNLTVTVSE